jgi:hypothetical protein
MKAFLDTSVLVATFTRITNIIGRALMSSSALEEKMPVVSTQSRRGLRYAHWYAGKSARQR